MPDRWAELAKQNERLVDDLASAVRLAELAP